MGQIIDNAIAIRIIYLLVKPFTKWDAYKLGMCDADGKSTGKKATNQQEKDSWTMLHRLVARLKRIIAIAPGGKSMIASVAAAYLLVRESYDNTQGHCDEYWSSHRLHETYYGRLNALTEEELQEVIPLLEDAVAPTNSVTSGEVAGIGAGAGLSANQKEVPGPKRKTYRERNLLTGPKAPGAIVTRTQVLEFKEWLKQNDS